MTGSAQPAALRGLRPSRVQAPDAAALKMLQSRPPTPAEPPLPEEAQGLKDLLLAAPPRAQRSRFSFARLRRVVVPPVQIPPELDAPNAVSNIVAGAKIPMTKAMWARRRARMLRRLPGRIDERVAW